MSKRRQIRAYVAADEHALFKEYARSIGLDQSSLLILLILRAGRFGPSDWERLLDASGRVVTGKAKVTAHVKEADVYAKVVSVPDMCPYGLSLGRICAALVRLELEERWLGRIVV